MKIRDVRTTLLAIPDVGGNQDATTLRPITGRTNCFVHVISDIGLEGLG